MRSSRLPAAYVSSLLLIILCACSAFAQGSRAASASDIAYTVSMTKPHTHLLEVEMRLRQPDAGGSFELVMPVWTPGSYLVREYERHVQDFVAKDAAGRALSWDKTSKNSWKIQTGGAREFVVTYSVYANELSVRTSELNDRHAFWNNATLLMYPDGHLQAPSTLRVNPAPGWKIATGLPAVSGRENTFAAENFDTLYDSPVEVSNFKLLTFEVKGVPHRIVIDGEGNYDPERMRRDVRKIVEEESAMMGDIPYRDYTFILHLRGGGGLEHLNSTALGFPRFGFRAESSYRSFLSLVAHEFYHLWNVKRIRPDALGPFDYTRENYTKLLWVAEGLTEYYSHLLLRRAGLITEKEYLDHLADGIRGLQNTPGRFEQSLEESSFDAWVKYYRQDENSVNTQISYYDKGEIVGALLDLEIRRLSGGAKSLDDVMRHLYGEFFKKGRNYTPADFQHVSEMMAGSSLDQFFSRYVRGREELDYNATLGAAGLRLEAPGRGDSSRARAYLGADLGMEGERLVVRRVYAGGPAYEQGLNAYDQVVALDGVRVNSTTLGERLSEKKPGDTARLTVFRFDELRTLDIKLGSRPAGDYSITADPQPAAGQTRIYQGWVGTRK